MFGDSQMITKNILWDRQRRESSFFFKTEPFGVLHTIPAQSLGYQHCHWIGFLLTLPETQLC